MKTFGAIILTLGAVISMVVFLGGLAGLVVPLLVIVTSIWVLIDARKLGVKAGQASGMKGMGPVGWFLSCILCWIVAFPYYVTVRDQLSHTQKKCAQCFGIVPDGARKCMHCGSVIELMFSIQCPACGERGQLTESQINAQIECPVCKRAFAATSARI